MAYSNLSCVAEQWAVPPGKAGACSVSMPRFLPPLPPCLFPLTPSEPGIEPPKMCHTYTLLYGPFWGDPRLRQVLRYFMGSRSYGHVHEMKWDTMAARILHIRNIGTAAADRKWWLLK